MDLKSDAAGCCLHFARMLFRYYLFSLAILLNWIRPIRGLIIFFLCSKLTPSTGRKMRLASKFSVRFKCTWTFVYLGKCTRCCSVLQQMTT